MALMFKDSVRLGSLATPQLVLGMVLTDQVYASAQVDECWITSVADSKHGPNSYHGKGRAFDVRVHDLGHAALLLIDARLRAKLCPLGFDVVLEDVKNLREGAIKCVRGPNEHFHIEWDPK